MFFCHSLQNPRKRSCEFSNTELHLYAAKTRVWVEHYRKSTKLLRWTDSHRAAEKICHIQHLSISSESQIASVLVGGHVCLNTALSGLLDVLFWQTQSSADGQASSSWTFLPPCQLFIADDRQSRFPSGGIPSFSQPYKRLIKKKEEKKKSDLFSKM